MWPSELLVEKKILGQQRTNWLNISSTNLVAIRSTCRNLWLVVGARKTTASQTTISRYHDNPERKSCPPHSVNQQVCVCALPPTEGNQSNIRALTVHSGTTACKELWDALVQTRHLPTKWDSVEQSPGFAAFPGCVAAVRPDVTALLQKCPLVLVNVNHSCYLFYNLTASLSHFTGKKVATRGGSTCSPWLHE